MSKKITTYTIAALFMTISCTSIMTDKSLDASSIVPFGVVYSKVSPEQTKNYNLLILEPDLYSRMEIMAIKAPGTKVYGYLSVGEVGPWRWYFSQMQEIGLLGVNQDWGSYYLDLSKPETRNLLLHTVLPEMIAKGVDGVFLDTVDAVAPYGQRNHLEPFMLELISSIKTQFPDIKVIQNAGLFMLKDTRPFIDAVLIEDISTNYDFQNQHYIFRDESDWDNRIEQLSFFWNQFDLPFLLLDFTEDPGMLPRIQARMDELQYPYFISNIRLDSLPSNPALHSNSKKLRK